MVTCKRAPLLPSALPADLCPILTLGTAFLLAFALFLLALTHSPDPAMEDWRSPGILLFELLLAGTSLGLLGIGLKGRCTAAHIISANRGIEVARVMDECTARPPAEGDDSTPVFASRISHTLEHSRRGARENKDQCRLPFAGDNLLLLCATGKKGALCRILDVNALACQCLGYTREELLALDPRSVIRTQSDSLRAEHHPCSADLLPREGEPIPVEVTVHRIRSGGEPVALIIARGALEPWRARKQPMCRYGSLKEPVTQQTVELQAANKILKQEIWKRKRIEREKTKAYQQIEKNIELFAVLTDHIRNPLQVIQGMADLVEDERMGKIQEQVETIKTTLKQLDEGWVESEKVREYLRRHR